jgi:hypothetical protein
MGRRQPVQLDITTLKDQQLTVNNVEPGTTARLLHKKSHVQMVTTRLQVQLHVSNVQQAMNVLIKHLELFVQQECIVLLEAPPQFHVQTASHAIQVLQLCPHLALRANIEHQQLEHALHVQLDSNVMIEEVK